MQKMFEKHRKKIVFLDNKFYEPCFSADPVCRPADDTIMDHQHEMSWIHPDFKWTFKYLFGLLYVILAVIPLALMYYVYVYITLRPKSRLRGSR